MENRILLLEDDLSLIDGLQYSLKKNGFDLEIARTVNEAMELIAKTNTIYCCLMLPCLMERALWFANRYERTAIRCLLFF